MADLIAYPDVGYNTWIDEDGAKEHFESRLHTDDWLAADASTQAAALLMGFRSLNELEFDLWWKLDKTLADRYSVAKKAEILDALKQAQCEEALHLLRHDLDALNIQAASLGGCSHSSLTPARIHPATAKELWIF